VGADMSATHFEAEGRTHRFAAEHLSTALPPVEHQTRSIALQEIAPGEPFTQTYVCTTKGSSGLRRRRVQICHKTAKVLCYNLFQCTVIQGDDCS
jgi:hypothetical protein